jgi:hypothetical protein
MSTIKVYYKEAHRVFEANKVITVAFINDDLLITMIGIFGEIDSKTIDGTLIYKFEVKREEWK